MTTISKNAVIKIKQLMSKDNKDNYILRVGVKGGGCSGLVILWNL